MKLLLDENFPLPLYHRLRTAGYDVDHVIALGQRGLPDHAIRQRLEREDLIFLTQDTEFLDVTESHPGAVIVSRVRQDLPIAARVDLWFGALERFVAARPTGTIADGNDLRAARNGRNRALASEGRLLTAAMAYLVGIRALAGIPARPLTG